MKSDKLSSMTGGWFVGNFLPTIHSTPDFEVCIKHYKKGDTEQSHFQKTALEITVVISGRVRMGENVFETDAIVLLDPGEVCDFEALEDSVVVAVKSPSLPSDKVVV
jgi:hypothetical protein